MQDSFAFSNRSTQRPKTKPPRKQVGLLQPKGPIPYDNSGKSFHSKPSKRSKKSKVEADQGHYMMEDHNMMTAGTIGSMQNSRSMADVTEADSRSMYRALKRKYMMLEEESFKLAEELEITDNEVKQLEEEKLSLLDELLVLEGLAYNPYPPVQTQHRNSVNFHSR